MDSKPPPAEPKPLMSRRKIYVVYYLSRSGQMDHPHLLEGYLTAAQDGLCLKDFKTWLAALRGQSMPNSFGWSYKRNYKNGFIWYDLDDNGLIQPVSKNEYVLMGSEIRQSGIAGKCECGGVMDQRKMDGETMGIIKGPLSTNSSGSILIDPGREGRIPKRFVEAEIYENNHILISDDTQSGDKSFALTTQHQLEEIKRPHNTQNTPNTNVLSRSNIRPIECEIASMEELRAASATEEMIKAHPINQSQSMYKSQHNDGGSGHLITSYEEINFNADEVTSDNIMDAATQISVDSTKCSADGEKITPSNNRLKVASPGSSTNGDYGRNKRVSSAKLIHESGVINGRLSQQSSKEFSYSLPAVEKAIVINHCSDLTTGLGDNHATVNSIASPALSASSAFSSKSARFASEHHLQLAADSNYKPYQRYNHRGLNLCSSVPYVFRFKQSLSCGSKCDVINMSSSAVSAAQQTPSSISSNPSTKAQNKGNSWKCRLGQLNSMMRRISTSPDNKSVISTGVSDQCASVKDSVELASSAESVAAPNIQSMIRDNPLYSSVNQLRVAMLSDANAPPIPEGG